MLMKAMFDRVSVTIVLFVHLCCCSSASSAPRQFHLVTSPTNGQPLCAVDQPTSSTTSGRMTSLRCAEGCAVKSCCLAYQFRSDASKCDLFGFSPTAYNKTAHCMVYAATPAPCPGGFQAVSCSNCFRMLGVTRGLTWQQAAETCRALIPGRSNLVIIGDAKKEALAIGFVKLNGASCYQIWTSGQRITVTGSATSFVWKPQTNISLPITYTRWSPGNLSFTSGNEYCLGMLGPTTGSQLGQWNEAVFSILLCALCELIV